MIKLIPMAGEGQRFKDEGYIEPKPLIDVLGLPMVVQAALSLPECQNNIFICRDFHIAKYKIDQEIRKTYPNAKFISIDKLTEGQAATCLLAEKYINNDEELIIGASDNGMIYDMNNFNKVKATADAIVFSFRNNVTVVEKPEHYGWLEVDDSNTLIKASVKKPISSNPIQDHAIVGSFWFKEGKYFVEAAKKMMKENRRINQEFYIDECLNDLLDLGLKVKVFEINYYIGWGTPKDLKTFFYWEEFFKKMPFHNYD